MELPLYNLNAVRSSRV